MNKIELRNANGETVADIPNSVAMKLIDESIGDFQIRYFKSGNSYNCFVFKEDYSMSVLSDVYTLFIYKGYYLKLNKIK